jgi:aminopeptidase N
MLHQYLGPDDFRDGLRHYLKKHAYSNTDTVDLWNSLEHVSKKPVKQFMHAWTSQPGYPILSVMRGKDGGLFLSQHRFYINPKKSEHPSHELWPIPLLPNHPLSTDTLNKHQEVIKNVPGWVSDILNQPAIKVPQPNSQYLLLNNESSGFYITDYATKSLFNSLKHAVKRGQLSPLNRLKLLSDTFEMAKSGYSGATKALELLSAYDQEDNAVVWDVMAGVVGGIRGVMDDDELRESMKPFVRKLVAKQLKRLGWEPKKGESHFDSLLRPTILGMASAADDPAVLAECQKRFKAMKRPEDIAPDLRGVIYTTVARHGDVKTFDRLLELHNSTTLSEEQTTLAAALTNFKQPALFKRALALINTDTVRLQDVGYWVAYSFMNRFAKDATWEWLKKHWDWLEQNMGNDLGFYRFPIYAARSFSDTNFIPKYKAFFEPKLSPAMNRSYHQGLEIIQWQSAWRTRDLAAIKKFFAL